jgi:hypothetical protein
MLAEGVVVEADDRNVVRAVQSSVSERLNGANGQEVSVDEQSSWSLGSDSEKEEARGPGTIFGEVVRLLRGRRVMAAKWVPASRCAPPLSFGVGSSGPPNVLVRGSVWLNDVSNGYLAWALSEFAGTTGTIVSRNRHADQPFYSQVSGS